MTIRQVHIGLSKKSIIRVDEIWLHSNSEKVMKWWKHKTKCHFKDFFRIENSTNPADLQTKCAFGAVSGWNATLHSRVGRLFSCSVFLLYYVVLRSSKRWRQTCTQSIVCKPIYILQCFPHIFRTYCHVLLQVQNRLGTVQKMTFQY